MEDKDMFILCTVTIVWLFSSIIYMLEKGRKINKEDDCKEDKDYSLKRNFRTVHPDNRKNFNNLVNDDGTPYVNEEFSCRKN